MEIHQQHHHDHPQHKEKLWTHYTLEFFMLFLAVFCGFLTENFREHQIEKSRELVYMQNMYEDLKTDTAIFSSYVIESKVFFEKIDTLEMLMNTSMRNSQLNKIYFASRSASLLTFSLFPNERTFEQMKAAGNLRLISNRQVADSVSSYYNSLKRIGYQNDLLQDRVTDYMQAMGKVFDAGMLYKILKEEIMPPLDSCKVITNDNVVINELLTRSQYFYGARRVQMNFGIERAKTAKNLMELIKKEYRVE